MYSIGQVIYGWDLTASGRRGEDWGEGHEIAMEEAFDGLMTWYSGAGYTPLALGREISRIDVCAGVDLEDLMTKARALVTEELKAEVEAMPQILFEEEWREDLDLRDPIPDYVKERLGEDPKIRIVWSTS